MPNRCMAAQMNSLHKNNQASLENRELLIEEGYMILEAASTEEGKHILTELSGRTIQREAIKKFRYFFKKKYALLTLFVLGMLRSLQTICRLLESCVFS